MKKKNGFLYIVALILFNVTVFTDFLPYNTMVKFIALILLLVDFILVGRQKIAISPLLRPLLWLNIVIALNGLVGGDLSFIFTFTINVLSIILAVQSPIFAKTEVKIMSVLLTVHLACAFFVELAPSTVVDDVFSRIILNRYNSNFSWRNVTGINVGLTNQPGVLSAYMVALSALFFAKYCNKKKLRYIIGYILSTAVILLTTKRSAILFSIIALVSVGVIFAGRRIKKHLNKHFGKYTMFVVVGVLLSFELNKKFDLLTGILDKNETLLENNDLSNGRFSIWKDAITYFLDKPVFGIGFKNYYQINGYDIHNTYIQFLVEAGVVGFIVLVINVLKILTSSIAGLRRKNKDGLSHMDVPAIVGVYLLIFLILYGFVGNTFIDYAPLSLFMISVGLINSDVYSTEKQI